MHNLKGIKIFIVHTRCSFEFNYDILLFLCCVRLVPVPITFERVVARLSLRSGTFGRMMSVSVTADSEFNPEEIVL